jgi:hypothetical protein
MKPDGDDSKLVMGTENFDLIILVIKAMCGGNDPVVVYDNAAALVDVRMDVLVDMAIVVTVIVLCICKMMGLFLNRHH